MRQPGAALVDRRATDWPAPPPTSPRIRTAGRRVQQPARSTTDPHRTGPAARTPPLPPTPPARRSPGQCTETLRRHIRFTSSTGLVEGPHHRSALAIDVGESFDCSGRADPGNATTSGRVPGEHRPDARPSPASPHLPRKQVQHRRDGAPGIPLPPPQKAVQRNNAPAAPARWVVECKHGLRSAARSRNRRRCRKIGWSCNRPPDIALPGPAAAPSIDPRQVATRRLITNPAEPSRSA